MHYSPAELELVPLKDVLPGSLVEIVGRSKDIPLSLRLANHPGSERARIMFLGGPRSLDVTDSLHPDTMTRVVCKASDLRVRLNEQSADKSYWEEGMLSLFEHGASISIAPPGEGFPSPQISMNTWGNNNQADGDDGHMVYPNWELGMENSQGEFVPLFQRNKKAPS